MSPTGQKRSASAPALLSLADLTPDPENRRQHTPRNVGLIVDAIQSVGAARSIVIDEDGVILAGNATVEAAAEAGLRSVRVIDASGHELVAVRRTGLTPAQKRDLAMYDNRAGELAEWNPAQLTEDLNAGEELDKFFRKDELAAILLKAERKHVEFDAAEDVPPANTCPTCGQAVTMSAAR